MYWPIFCFFQPFKYVRHECSHILSVKNNLNSRSWEQVHWHVLTCDRVLHVQNQLGHMDVSMHALLSTFQNIHMNNVLCLRSHLSHGWEETMSRWLVSPGGEAVRERPQESRPGVRCSLWKRKTELRWMGVYLKMCIISLSRYFGCVIRLCVSEGGCSAGGHSGSLWQSVHHQRLCHSFCSEHYDQLCAGVLKHISGAQDFK